MNYSLMMLLIGVASLVVTVILLIALVFAIRVRRRRKKVDPDAGLDEDLSQFPPAPASASIGLRFEGQPVRIRLLVLAAGRNVELTADMADAILQSVVYGLGKVAESDRPRIRIWPAQLSHAGFAPTFFRHVRRAESAGEPSPWIVVAGPARSGHKSVLIGMALAAAEPTDRGNVHLDEEGWDRKFRVQFPE